MEPLAEALSKHRQQLGLSHDDMARRLGISRTTWFDTVRGRRPVGRAVRLGVVNGGNDFAALLPLLEREEVGAA